MHALGDHSNGFSVFSPHPPFLDPNEQTACCIPDSSQQEVPLPRLPDLTNEEEAEEERTTKVQKSYFIMNSIQYDCEQTAFLARPCAQAFSRTVNPNSLSCKNSHERNT